MRVKCFRVPAVLFTVGARFPSSGRGVTERIGALKYNYGHKLLYGTEFECKIWMKK
jgi:hypothetical protein